MRLAPPEVVAWIFGVDFGRGLLSRSDDSIQQCVLCSRVTDILNAYSEARQNWASETHRQAPAGAPKTLNSLRQRPRSACGSTRPILSLIGIEKEKKIISLSHRLCRVLIPHSPDFAPFSIGHREIF